MENNHYLLAFETLQHFPIEEPNFTRVLSTLTFKLYIYDNDNGNLKTFYKYKIEEKGINTEDSSNRIITKFEQDIIWRGFKSRDIPQRVVLDAIDYNFLDEPFRGQLQHRVNWSAWMSSMRFLI